jgi:replicative DNA helicase
MTFTLRDLAECAERELKLRRRVYANRVDTGRMSQNEAERQIAMMEAIAAKLREEEQQWELLV